MSNFLINPYSFGAGAASSTVTIDLSASPTQADFDIDVSDCDILEVFYIDAELKAGTGVAPEVQFSDDGGSTFKSTSGDYYTTIHSTFSSTNVYVTKVGFSSPSGAGYISGSLIFGGFPTGRHGWVQGHSTQSGFNSSGRLYLGRTQADTYTVDTVRLGTLSTQWGTSGKVVAVKRSLASSLVLTERDYSVDASATDGLTFAADTYYRVMHWEEAVRNSGVSSRSTYRLADSSGIDSGSVYSETGYNITVGGATTWINVSLDNTNTNYNHGSQWTGMNLNNGQAAHIASSKGYGDMGGVAALGDSPQGIYPHSWADSTSYNTGTAGGEAMEYTSSVLETITTGTTPSEVIVDVEGYDECTLVIPGIVSPFSGAANLLCQYSTDGGSSFVSTAHYDWHRELGSHTDGDTSFLLGDVNTSFNKAWLTFRGLSDTNAPLTVFGHSMTTSQRARQGSTSVATPAITHLRLYPSTGTWATGVTFYVTKAAF